LNNKKSKPKPSLTIKRKKSYEIFPDILSDIKENGKLSADNIDELEKIFGDRVQKAIGLVSSNKVVKYTFVPSKIIRWVVVGHEKEYLVIEKTFCSCKGFIYTTLLRKGAPSCYHLLARELAERMNKFKEVTLDDVHYQESMNKWLS